MPESLRKSRENFETKLKQKVETHVPQELHDDFWAYYDIWREQVREQVLMNLSHVRTLYSSDVDHEGITIESVLNVWSQDQRERREEKQILPIDHV